MRERADLETGEITRVPTGRFTMKKRDIRPRDAVHMCRVFAGRSIDEFAFAAGNGRAVLRAINREALAPFNHWEVTQPYKLAEKRACRAARSRRPQPSPLVG